MNHEVYSIYLKWLYRSVYLHCVYKCKHIQYHILRIQAVCLAHDNRNGQILIQFPATCGGMSNAAQPSIDDLLQLWCGAARTFF